MCALTLGGWREWRRVRIAREDFDRSMATWQFKQITFMDAVVAADKLYEVESKTLWISSRTAARRQVERLKSMVREARGNTDFAMGAASEEVWEDLWEEHLLMCDQVETRAATIASEYSLTLPDDR